MVSAYTWKLCLLNNANGGSCNLLKTPLYFTNALIHPFPLLPLRLGSSPTPLHSTSIPVSTISNPVIEIKNRLRWPLPVLEFVHGDGGSNDNNQNNNGDGGSNSNDDNNYLFDDGDGEDSSRFFRLLLSSFLVCFCCFFSFQLASAIAIARNITTGADSEHVVWEVKGSKWTPFFADFSKDAFVAATSSMLSVGDFWAHCRNLVVRLLLPEGFPGSVTADYLDYSLWRGVQGVASQISGVLATQALLYAVGLGKGAIPTAAAINWVLKDGIGYLSKIMLSKYGRHFDVNPKGWRLFADLLENAAFGMEMLTPAFPHLFVLIGAVAGAGRSAAALIQAATRSCFYAGFAAQRNFAEVIAKGEAQGMVSKSIGIMLGIALANSIGTSTTLGLSSFCLITWIHMYCNLKSYQCIQLRTLNPYRASLVFSEYLLSGQAPPIKDVNDEEPLFPTLPFLCIRSANKAQPVSLSLEAMNAAAKIDRRLELGSKLSDIIYRKEDALALFNLYRDEGYILMEHKGKFCIVLKESSSPKEMLKSLFQVNYLYWLEKNAGIEARGVSMDCKPGGRLQMSLDYVRREFNHVKNDSESVGWIADGLIARPLSNRIRLGYAGSSPTS